MNAPVPDPTPAVRRAATFLYPGSSGALTDWQLDNARGGLAAGLDAEEMARSVADDLAGQDVHALVMRRPGESYRDQAERIGAWAAGVIGAAILGDDRGEADPLLLLIVLGVVVAVLAGAAVLAIATGLLG